MYSPISGCFFGMKKALVKVNHEQKKIILFYYYLYIIFEKLSLKWYINCLFTYNKTEKNTKNFKTTIKKK